MAPRPTYCISSAIPYANGAPHIGHAYERIAQDAIARFKRLDGYDVLTLSGMDEHGQKMQQTAAREGLTPQGLADRTAAQFLAMNRLLGTEADDLVRTTEPRHRVAVQEIWRRMEARGDIYLSRYPGWYSVRDEAYHDEADLVEGPDGTRLAPTGTPVEWVEEESWFFRLSAYADRLLAHYAAHPDFVTPEKYRNEVASFVARGLNDLSISRTTFDWGIPVPGDPKHVMYVWVDALTNYLTGTGFPDADAPARPLLARRRPPHRQGYQPLPRGLLARLPDVGGAAPAPAGGGARLLVQPRREDVEVGRQRHLADDAGRALRRRRSALLLPARGALRPGRQLFARGHRGADQRRPRQRPRQPRPALALDDRQELRRRRAGARATSRRRTAQILAEADALLDRARAAHARHRAARVPRPGLARRGRRQPLLHGRGALDQAQDRPGPHGHDPVGHGRSAARGGAGGPARDADRDGQAARPARRAARRPGLRPCRRGAPPRAPARRCRRRPSSSPATSRPRPPRERRPDADRQPLPPRLSGVRVRTRRRSSRGPGRPASPASSPSRPAWRGTPTSPPSRSGSPTCSSPSARIRCRPPRSRTCRWSVSSTCRAIPNASASARRVSTTTTMRRRATWRSGCSAPISRRRARPACRW